MYKKGGYSGMKYPSHFQGANEPPVDPYIRTGIKPDLVKAKKSLWKRLFNIG